MLQLCMTFRVVVRLGSYVYKLHKSLLSQWMVMVNTNFIVMLEYSDLKLYYQSRAIGHLTCLHYRQVKTFIMAQCNMWGSFVLWTSSTSVEYLSGVELSEELT